MSHRHSRHSWIFFPYDTCRRNRSGIPGSSNSRHLTPSGFAYPLDVLLPVLPHCCPPALTLPSPKTRLPCARASRIRLMKIVACGLRLMTIRRPPSVHGVLPSGSCSSRPAVPLSGPRLSCHFPAPRERDSAVAPEVSPCPRFLAAPAAAGPSESLPGRGTTNRTESSRHPRERMSQKHCDRRTLPSWVFAPPGLSPPPPWLPAPPA
jgi:hypothetical protein